MDSISLLICFGVFLLSGGILLVISLLGVKGQSYEDVLAERRRVLIQVQSNEKNKKNKGPKKKEKPHVHILDKPIVADSNKNINSKKNGVKKNDPKHHSILLNKDEGGRTNEIFEVTSVLPPNHFEKSHPKDEVEKLHQEQQSHKDEPKKLELKNSEPKKIEAKNLEPKKTEPKKIEPKNTDVKKVETKNAEPKNSESKKMETKNPEPKKMEPKKLKNKEENNSKMDQTKKSNNKTAQNKLNEQVADVILTNDNVDNVNNKKAVNLIKSEESTVSSTNNKKKKKGEINSLQQLNQNGGGKSMVIPSGVRDGEMINVLMSQVRKIDLSRTDIQLLINMLLNKQLEAPENQPPDWSQGRQDPLNKLKKQLAEKELALEAEQAQFVGLQAKLRDLRQELNAERTTNVSLHREFENFKINTEKRQHQLAQQFRQREEILRQQKSEENRRMEMVRQELDSYRNAHQQMVVQLHQKDELENEKKKILDQFQILQNDHSKILSERKNFELKFQKISELYENEIFQKEKFLEEITNLEMLLKNQKDEFKNELIEKNEILKKSENEILKLKNFIDTQNQKFQNLTKEFESKIEKLTSQFEEQRDKNNELRKKNWKIMEALNNAEAQSKAKINHESLNTQMEEVEKKLLLRLFPEMIEQEPNKQTESSALRILEDLRSSNQDQNSHSNNSESENLKKIEKLHIQKNNYEKILLETEKMLQNLENHIQAEEKKWRNEMVLKDFEISNLTAQLAHFEKNNTSNLPNGQSPHSNQISKTHNTSNGVTVTTDDSDSLSKMTE